MMSRSRRGLDGHTAFKLRKRKLYRKRLPPFAEMMYLEAGIQKSRLEDRDRSDEVVIGTREGVVKVPTVKWLDGAKDLALS